VKRNPLPEEAVISQRQLAAGITVPVFTSSKLVAVKVKVGNRAGSIHCIYLVSKSVEN
jgi:hypothetical protein